MTRPYVGPAYSPRQVRDLVRLETPERMTQHSKAGRRTIQGDEATIATATVSSAIIQPEWTSDFYRVMQNDQEMARAKNFWYLPVRRALAKLGEIPADWGQKRRERRLLLKRCMTLYLISNYEVPMIAAATGLKRHEAYRALEDAAAIMTRSIGVFGREFREYDQQAFMAGLR